MNFDEVNFLSQDCLLLLFHAWAASETLKQSQQWMHTSIVCSLFSTCIQMELLFIGMWEDISLLSLFFLHYSSSSRNSKNIYTCVRIFMWVNPDDDFLYERSLTSIGVSLLNVLLSSSSSSWLYHYVNRLRNSFSVFILESCWDCDSMSLLFCPSFSSFKSADSTR